MHPFTTNGSSWSGLFARKSILKHFSSQDSVFGLLSWHPPPVQETHCWVASTEAGITQIRAAITNNTFMARLETIDEQGRRRCSHWGCQPRSQGRLEERPWNDGYWLGGCVMQISNLTTLCEPIVACSLLIGCISLTGALHRFFTARLPGLSGHVMIKLTRLSQLV